MKFEVDFGLRVNVQKSLPIVDRASVPGLLEQLNKYPSFRRENSILYQLRIGFESVEMGGSGSGRLGDRFNILECRLRVPKPLQTQRKMWFFNYILHKQDFRANDNNGKRIPKLTDHDVAIRAYEPRILYTLYPPLVERMESFFHTVILMVDKRVSADLMHLKMTVTVFPTPEFKLRKNLADDPKFTTRIDLEKSHE